MRVPNFINHQHLNSPKLRCRFNAAAWQMENNRTILLAREVLQGNTYGKADKGNMVRLELNGKGSVIREDTIWYAEGATKLLEDPRALVLPNKKLALGLTALDVSEEEPYPAVLTLSDLSVDRLPEVSVITKFGPGKNTTPVSNNIYFYRQDDRKSSHRLFEFGWDGKKAVGLDEVQFPTDIPWASWRIGTTIPPIWRNEHEALMIIHGITIEKGKYVYAIGRAKLSKKKTFGRTRYVVEVDPTPILTPDDFIGANGQALVEELHPELRRVVYACGGLMKRKFGNRVLSLFVNVGDRQTVEVGFWWKDLIEKWWVN